MNKESAAILVPTYRTGHEQLANLAYLAACSHDDLVIYFGDNSESHEKHQYLRMLSSIYPNIRLILHSKNIGALFNIFQLLDASKSHNLLLFATDDDRVSLSFIQKSFEDLRADPDISRSAGSLLRIQSNGTVQNDTKDSISNSSIDRFLEYFDPNSFNQIHYSAFRRKSRPDVNSV